MLYRLLVLGLLLLLCGPLWAHQDQTAPPQVIIRPQTSFLTVEIYGDSQDLSEAVNLDARGVVGTHAADTANIATKAAQNYLLDSLLLMQNGRVLKGRALALHFDEDHGRPSGNAFTAILRFERPVALASAPLQVSSHLFDYLGSSHTVVDLRARRVFLPAGGTANFPAQDAVSTASQNALDWGLEGLTHGAFNLNHLLFLVALLLPLAQLKPRVVLAALGIWTLSHGLTFAFCSQAAWMPSPLVVCVGVALSIALCGGYEWWLAWRSERAQTAPAWMLPVLALAAGAVHGFALAPSVIERGLPEAGYALSLLAFTGGSAVFGLLVFGAMMLAIRRGEVAFAYRASYGGTSWPLALQWVSLGVTGIGCFWLLQCLVEGPR